MQSTYTRTKIISEIPDYEGGISLSFKVFCNGYEWTEYSIDTNECGQVFWYSEYECGQDEFYTQEEADKFAWEKIKELWNQSIEIETY